MNGPRSKAEEREARTAATLAEWAAGKATPPLTLAWSGTVAAAVAPASSSLFQRIDLEGLEHDDTPAASFVMAPILPAGFVTLLGGHGNVGKSTLALAIAAHVAVGRDFGPYRTQAEGRVVFVSLEDPGKPVRARLRAVAECFDLPMDQIRARLETIGVGHSDTELMRRGAFAGALEETPLFRDLRRVAAGAALVVVDNASDAFGGNEIDRREVRAFMRALRTLEPSSAVLLLAHIDKAAARGASHGNAYSGSTAWHNSARSRLALLEAKGDPDWLELLHEKSNYAAPAAVLRLRREVCGEVMVPRPESRADTEASRAEQERGQQEADALALELIRVAHGAGEPVSASSLGPATGQAQLEALSGGRLSRMKARGSLERLAARGAIRQERVKDARQRKGRLRWVPSDAAPITPHTPR